MDPFYFVASAVFYARYVHICYFCILEAYHFQVLGKYVKK